MTKTTKISDLCPYAAPLLLPIAFCLFCAAEASAQNVGGPLVPPPSAFSNGAPTPTMTTLTNIDPRTPISSLPYTISTPGSYYLTSNLTGQSGSDGIDISVGDVTLDLNGFTLLGVSGSGDGIKVVNLASNLAIRNGVLDSWGGNGVNAHNGNNSHFERLRVSNSGNNGLYAGSNCVVLVFTASGNGANGISVRENCTVSGCTATGNAGGGVSVMENCIVKDCIATQNNGEQELLGNGISVLGNSTVSGCTATGNVDSGIVVTGGSCIVKDCIATQNNGEQELLGNGISVLGNSTVSGCTATGNVDSGIVVTGGSCIVKDCIANGNTAGDLSGGYGIYVRDGLNLVTGNTCSGNVDGIFIESGSNRVDGNNAGQNSQYGIYALPPNIYNCIIRNSAVGNGTSGYFNSGNNSGFAPIGTASTSTNPWQNF